MALRFGKKKTEDGPKDEGTVKQTDDFQAQPEKARKWFEHARQKAEAYDYGYALTLYANGVRLDPTVMSAHEEMFDVAVKYNNNNGKPASRKEIKDIEGPHVVEKFAAAEYGWLKDIDDAGLALRFLEAAIKARDWVAEVGRMHCPTILNVLRRQKKVSKGTFLQAKDLFPELGAWDEAIAAGESALAVDPKDAELQNELKDLAAQRAMDQGRYEEAAGQEGGFRKFVKDPDKQRALEEAEAISGGLDVEQRNLQRLRAEYEKNPEVPEVINQYGQLLKAVGSAEARQQAYDVYMKGYQDTGQYRFKAAAGDIRIEALQQRVKELQAKAADGDAATGEELQSARQEFRELRAREFGERVKEYPTDRRLKQKYGEVLLDLERHEEAMQCFQEAKDDPKLRVRAGAMLGRSFAAVGWHDIAIQEYKEALERVEADRDAELSIRYELMVSLMEQARREGSIELAREALEISSSIARKNIAYRDIRERRKQADDLIKELTRSGSDA